VQLLQALFQAGDQFVFAEVFNPDFGGDEQLITRHAALFDSLTNGSFVFIDLRGINSTIAQLSAVFTDAITTSSFRRKVPDQMQGLPCFPQSLCSLTEEDYRWRVIVKKSVKRRGFLLI
jgi:hypothetical protein